jgi:hypothetical protein
MLPVSINDVSHGAAGHKYRASFESGVDLLPEHQVGLDLGVIAAARQLHQAQANNAVRFNGQQDRVLGEKHKLPHQEPDATVF